MCALLDSSSTCGFAEKDIGDSVHIAKERAQPVWVGIGAALTVAWGVASGAESFSWAKVLLIAGLVACVVGLKLVGETR